MFALKRFIHSFPVIINFTAYFSAIIEDLDAILSITKRHRKMRQAISRSRLGKLNHGGTHQRCFCAAQGISMEKYGNDTYMYFGAASFSRQGAAVSHRRESEHNKGPRGTSQDAAVALTDIAADLTVSVKMKFRCNKW